MVVTGFFAQWYSHVYSIDYKMRIVYIAMYAEKINEFVEKHASNKEKWHYYLHSVRSRGGTS